MKKIYMLTCPSHDEDGYVNADFSDMPANKDFLGENATATERNEYLSAFLNQTDYSYVDRNGFVHEVYDGVDQVFGKYLDDIEPDTLRTLFTQLRAMKQKDAINAVISYLKENKGHTAP